MKRHLVRLLIAILSFLIGMAVTRLMSSNESTVKELPTLETYAPTPTPVFTATLPQPVIPVPAATETFVVMDFNWRQFDPAGFYFMGDRKPKAFAEVDGFSLEWWEGDNKELQGGAYLNVTSDGEYKPAPLRFVWVNKNRVVFATTAPTADDFEYRFDGRFLRSGVVAMAKPGTWVLEGTLTKTKGGKKVAEKVVKFQVEEMGGC